MRPPVTRSVFTNRVQTTLFQTLEDRFRASEVLNQDPNKILTDEKHRFALTECLQRAYEMTTRKPSITAAQTPIVKTMRQDESLTRFTLQIQTLIEVYRILIVILFHLSEMCMSLPPQPLDLMHLLSRPLAIPKRTLLQLHVPHLHLILPRQEMPL